MKTEENYYQNCTMQLILSSYERIH